MKILNTKDEKIKKFTKHMLLYKKLKQAAQRFSSTCRGMDILSGAVKKKFKKLQYLIIICSVHEDKEEKKVLVSNTYEIVILKSTSDVATKKKLLCSFMYSHYSQCDINISNPCTYKV